MRHKNCSQDPQDMLTGASRGGRMTAPDLAYVALVVDEPAASAAIFERDFGLPRRESLFGRPGGAGDFRRRHGDGPVSAGGSVPGAGRRERG